MEDVDPGRLRNATLVEGNRLHIVQNNAVRGRRIFLHAVRFFSAGTAAREVCPQEERQHRDSCLCENLRSKRIQAQPLFQHNLRTSQKSRIGSVIFKRRRAYRDGDLTL